MLKAGIFTPGDGRNCACQLSYEIEREHGVGEVGDLRV